MSTVKNATMTVPFQSLIDDTLKRFNLVRYDARPSGYDHRDGKITVPVMNGSFRGTATIVLDSYNNPSTVQVGLST